MHDIPVISYSFDSWMIIELLVADIENKKMHKIWKKSIGVKKNYDD